MIAIYSSATFLERILYNSCNNQKHTCQFPHIYYTDAIWVVMYGIPQGNILCGGLLSLFLTRWHYDMEMHAILLAICEENHK